MVDLVQCTVYTYCIMYMEENSVFLLSSSYPHTNRSQVEFLPQRLHRLEMATFLRTSTFSHMIVFSAQLAQGEGDRPPLSLHLPSPLELLLPLHPLPSKTSEILLPVLSHIAPLSFSLIYVQYQRGSIQQGSDVLPVLGGGRSLDSPLRILSRRLSTDKKVKKNFLIYREIQKGVVGKSYMTNGLLIYD